MVDVDPGLSGGGRHGPGRSPDGATFVAAMRLEALAIGGKVVRTGMGHVHAHAAAKTLAAGLEPGAAVVLAGISGGLDPALQPGDIVVATSVRGPDGDELALSATDAATVAKKLRGAGHSVHLGPIVSSKTLVHGERRAELARSGALAVDMESAWVARALREPPCRDRAARGRHGRELRGRTDERARGSPPRPCRRRSLARHRRLGRRLIGAASDNAPGAAWWWTTPTTVVTPGRRHHDGGGEHEPSRAEIERAVDPQEAGQGAGQGVSQGEEHHGSEPVIRARLATRRREATDSAWSCPTAVRRGRSTLLR